MLSWFSGLTCLLLLSSVQTQPVEEWRAAFDKHYALELASILVEWNGKPRWRGSYFNAGGDGMNLLAIWESVLKLKPYEIEAPRDLLEREFMGDWVVRADAKPDQLLEALARLISEELGDQYGFVPQKQTCEVVVVRGHVNRQVRPTGAVKLDLPVEGVLFREHFGGSTSLKHFFSRLSAASGWVVIDETDQKQLYVRIEYGDDKKHELAPPDVSQIPREQMEQLVKAIEEQIGLELTFEQKDLVRWALERS
jgi:hypothetical protein